MSYGLPCIPRAYACFSTQAVRGTDHLATTCPGDLKGTIQPEGGTTMKIGIITFSVDVAALAKRAEELGFDSFWIPEHPATPVHIAPKTTTYRLHLEPDGTPQPLYRSGKIADPFISLARASAVTQTIKLGTGIWGVSHLLHKALLGMR
jgi:hypothetical protein